MWIALNILAIIDLDKIVIRRERNSPAVRQANEGRMPGSRENTDEARNQKFWLGVERILGQSILIIQP